MKKTFLICLSIITLLITAACGSEAAEESEENIKDLVNEYSTGSFDDVSASITSNELIVTESNGEKTTYQLPEDEFFVSIAPYVETTHPCEIHSLTGCQGELVDEEFHVHISDEEGNVFMEETVVSPENGFIDLWLPRDGTFQVTIEHDGKLAEQEITTFEDDHTCITTMKLM